MSPMSNFTSVEGLWDTWKKCIYILIYKLDFITDLSVRKSELPIDPSWKPPITNFNKIF
jgi:hypothetical protein